MLRYLEGSALQRKVCAARLAPAAYSNHIYYY